MPRSGSHLSADTYSKHDDAAYRFAGVHQVEALVTAEIRKVIYTTNAIESVNMSLRKVTKSRGSFPNDDALIKLYYLALRNISKKWTKPIQNWKAALNRFTIMFDERMPQH